MAETTRKGRRRKPSSSPLGALVMSRLDALHMPTELFARRLGVSRTTVWRLLLGKTAFSNRVTLADLCRSLEFVGDERRAFVEAYERERLNHSARARREAKRRLAPGVETGTDAMPPAEVATATPPARFGAFLAARIARAGLSHHQFAQAVGVAPSTLSRVLRGKIRMTHTLDVRVVAHALALDRTDRRILGELAVDAGVIALGVSAAPPNLPFLTLERSLGRTLDDIEREVISLRERRNRGEVAAAYGEAHALFRRLFDYPLPVTTMAKSPELARVKLRVGFEHCEAQAAALRWYERAGEMMRTLDRMEADVLRHFPPRELASEYGHLVNLRAPLLREQPAAAHGSAGGPDESIWQFTWAFESLMPWIVEPILKVELLRNRAHTYLLRQGDGDLARWRTDLTTAASVAAAIRGPEREAFRALVEYSWGEGYKRLPDMPGLTPRQRAQHVRQAMDALAAGDADFRTRMHWQGYSLLARIAAAQCVAWQDLDEALRQGEHLRADALRTYPALAQKVDRMMSSARQLRRQTVH